MKLFRYILIFFLVILNASYSQSGLKFAELAQRLDPYFDQLLIQDIPRQLPQGVDYTIWGWDVGDYSGDGYYDVAFSAKLSSDRGRTLHVYQFVDIDGYLVKVGTSKYDFVDIPLEIGVVIKNNTCMITQKQKQFNWTVFGFTYDNGVLMQKSKFTTERIGEITRESYKNYISMKNEEKYLYTRNGELIFRRDYLTIPSYPRGKTIYKGYTEEILADYTDYVHEGAIYRESSDDISFKVSSAYDDLYIYFTVDVTDDSVVPEKCDTCIHDNIDLWIDVNERVGEGDRFVIRNGNKIDFRGTADSGLFNFSIHPGNFYDIKPAIKVKTNRDLSSSQKSEVRNIKIVSNITNEGYIVKFKIPFAIFGFFRNPVSDEEYIELGCSVIVNDYDNEFRADEYTCIGTSQFISNDPTYYGSLLLIPNEEWYGQSNNIFTEEIIENLLNYGF